MTKFGHWFHDFLISCVVSLSHSLLFISFTRASFSALLVISRDGYLEGSFLSLFHRPLGPGVSTWFCWTSFSMQSAFSLTYISVLFFPGEKNRDFAWLQSYGDFQLSSLLLIFSLIALALQTNKQTGKPYNHVSLNFKSCNYGETFWVKGWNWSVCSPIFW